MSRNAAAAELQSVISQIQRLAMNAERLATASGGLVDPVRFKGVQGLMTMAAGDLDSKGLLIQPAEAKV